jgi:hypothetical protein
MDMERSNKNDENGTNINNDNDNNNINNKDNNNDNNGNDGNNDNNERITYEKLMEHNKYLTGKFTYKNSLVNLPIKTHW